VIDELTNGDEVLAVAFRDDGPGEAAATMNGTRVLVNYRTGMPPFSMAVPRQTDAEAVVAELRNLGYDVALRDTLVALARRFGSEAKS